MQNRRASQSKPIKFLDTKMLLATTSVAVTLGLWNMFSHDALKVEFAAPPIEDEPPQDTASSDMPPLPTLVPLVSLSETSNQAAAAPANSAVVSENPSADLPLRSVSAPDSPAVVQKYKPIVDSPVYASEGKKSNGGGGSSAVTSTRSSK